MYTRRKSCTNSGSQSLDGETVGVTCMCCICCGWDSAVSCEFYWWSPTVILGDSNFIDLIHHSISWVTWAVHEIRSVFFCVQSHNKTKSKPNKHLHFVSKESIERIWLSKWNFTGGFTRPSSLRLGRVCALCQGASGESEAAADWRWQSCRLPVRQLTLSIHHRPFTTIETETDDSSLSWCHIELCLSN